MDIDARPTARSRPQRKLWLRILCVGVLGAEGVLVAYATVVFILAQGQGSGVFGLIIYAGSFIAVPTGLIFAVAAIVGGALGARRSARVELLTMGASGFGLAVLSTVLLCLFGPIGVYFAAFVGGGGAAATIVFLLMARAYLNAPYDSEREERREEARKRDERELHDA